MTRKTFDQLMTEVFLTGDVPDMTATTATTASAEPAPALTLDTLLEVRRKLMEDYPVTYHIASEHVEKNDAVYKVPNEYARCGYDLICHPDMVPTLVANYGGTLRLMDSAERRRRDDLMWRRMHDDMGKRISSCIYFGLRAVSQSADDAGR